MGMFWVLQYLPEYLPYLIRHCCQQTDNRTLQLTTISIELSATGASGVDLSRKNQGRHRSGQNKVCSIPTTLQSATSQVFGGSLQIYHTHATTPIKTILSEKTSHHPLNVVVAQFYVGAAYAGNLLCTAVGPHSQYKP